MSLIFSYKWNHDFPKIIRDSGYTFNLHKNRICINWNDIKAIDIDKIIQERDFLSIDKYVSEILDCQLEREFDTRILDSGFVKLFRLSQLSVEYLLECRKNLDAMVMTLKSEINEKTKEIEILHDKLDECLKELKFNSNRNKKNTKRRSKKETENVFKGMFVKNDNFLINNGQYNMQFHKCSCCEKVFMNQFFLESHIARRHPGMTIDNVNHEHDSSLEYLKSNDEIQKLSKQVLELKEALRSTQENLNKKEDNVEKSSPSHIGDDKINVEVINTQGDTTKQTKYEVDQKECEMISKEMFEKWKETEKTNMITEINELKEKILTSNKAEFEVIQKEIIDSNEKERSNLLLLIKNQEAEIKNINNLMKEKTFKEIDTLNENFKNQEEIWKKKLQDSEELHSAAVSELENRITELIKISKANEENYQRKIDEIEKSNKQEEAPNIIRTADILKEKNSSFRETENDETMDCRKNKFIGESQETLPPYKENDTHSSKAILLERPRTGIKWNSYKKYQQQNSFYTDSETEFMKNEIKLKPKTKKGKFNNNMMNKNKLAFSEIKTTKPKSKSTISNQNSNVENKINSNAQVQKSQNNIQLIDKIRTNLNMLIDGKMNQFGISKDSLGVTNNFYKKKMAILKRKQHLLNEKSVNYMEIKNSIMSKVDQEIKKPAKNSVGNEGFIKIKQSEHKTRNHENKNKISRSSKAVNIESSSTTEEDSNRELDLTDSNVKSESTDELLNLVVRKPAESTLDFSSSNMITSTPIKEILVDDENSTRAEKDDHKSTNYSMYAGVSSSSSDDSDIKKENSFRKALSEGNLNIKDESLTKKGVLKNAASTGSLAKKKVLFDLDANEIKSAKPLRSETIAVKTKNTWKNNLSLNTDSDSDWNFPIDNKSTKATVHVVPSESLQSSKGSTKIMELTKSIEAQLGARNQKPPIGGVNIMNTSTNSKNTFGESSSAPIPKPRTLKLKEKDTSDLEVSDWSIDDFIRSN